MRRRVDRMEKDFRVTRAVDLLMRRVAVQPSVVADLFAVDVRTVQDAIELGQFRTVDVKGMTLIATAPLQKDLGLEPPGLPEDEEGIDCQLPAEVVAALAEVAPKIDQLLNEAVRDYIRRPAAGA